MQPSADLIKEISNSILNLSDGPLLVHSDLFRAGVPIGGEFGRTKLLAAHWESVKRMAGNKDVWMPVFNYRFPDTGVFDVNNSVSEIGPLTEYFRNNVSDWRTPIPIFSFSGTGLEPPEDPGPEIDPFGMHSIYQHLIEANGVYLAYGASFRAANPIHVAERLSGGPLYRYDKFFPGVVLLKDGSPRQVVLKYHVRPWGTGLDYDYPRLLEDLIRVGVCRVWQVGTLYYMVAEASRIIDYWTESLFRDPLYLLNSETLKWVEPMLERLGRPFVIGDFEEASNNI